MRFRQRFDYISILLTILISAIAVTLGAGVFLTSTSSFMPAWITLLLTGVILLVVTSIPKYVEITPDALEIHCVVELTYIPLENIKSAKRVKFKSILPIQMLGVFGFFGYYGYYLSLNKLKMFRVYARNWCNLVQVETLEGKHYIISIQQPQEFMKLLEEKCPQLIKP